MTHHVIYLGNVGVGGRAKALRQHARLRDTNYEPGHSYEVALADRQPQVYGETLKELGFEKKIVSRNPNTGNKIEGWFKSVK